MDADSRAWKETEQMIDESNARIDHYRAEASSLRNHVEIENRNADREDSRLAMEQEKHDKEIEQMAATLDLSKAQTEVALNTASKLQKEIDNYDEYVKQVQASTNLSNQQARKVCAEAFISEMTASYVEIYGSEPPKSLSEACLRMAEDWDGSLAELKRQVRKKLFD